MTRPGRGAGPARPPGGPRDTWRAPGGYKAAPNASVRLEFHPLVSDGMRQVSVGGLRHCPCRLPPTRPVTVKAVARLRGRLVPSSAQRPPPSESEKAFCCQNVDNGQCEGSEGLLGFLQVRCRPVQPRFFSGVRTPRTRFATNRICPIAVFRVQAGRATVTGNRRRGGGAAKGPTHSVRRDPGSDGVGCCGAGNPPQGQHRFSRSVPQDMRVQAAGPRTREKPETLHGAPARWLCYGRENITVSRLHCAT